MFAKKQNPTPTAVEPTKLDSLIGDNLSLTGDITFSNGLRVDGRVDGSVTGSNNEKNLLILSEKGAITGRVQVYDAVINGSITGDLVVSHFLELQANAHVTGDISYRQFKMDCGAVINGRLEHLADEPPHKVLQLEPAKKEGYLPEKQRDQK